MLLFEVPQFLFKFLSDVFFFVLHVSQLVFLFCMFDVSFIFNVSFKLHLKVLPMLLHFLFMFESELCQLVPHYVVEFLLLLSCLIVDHVASVLLDVAINIDRIVHQSFVFLEAFLFSQLHLLIKLLFDQFLFICMSFLEFLFECLNFLLILLFLLFLLLSEILNLLLSGLLNCLVFLGVQVSFAFFYGKMRLRVAFCLQPTPQSIKIIFNISLKLEFHVSPVLLDILQLFSFGPFVLNLLLFQLVQERFKLILNDLINC